MKKVLLSLFAVFMSLGLTLGSVFLVEGLSKQQVDQLETSQTDEQISSTASGYWSNYAGNSLSGSGTSSNPYKIYTAVDLATFAKLINNDDDDYYKTKNYKLMNDIDISAHNWIPIGMGAHTTTSGWWIFTSTDYHPYRFSGTFDGGGNTISGLTINVNGGEDWYINYCDGYLTELKDDDSGSYFYSNGMLGFFGYVYEAEIYNLYFGDGIISVKNNDYMRVNGRIGVLAGAVMGSNINNIYNNGVDIKISVAGNLNNSSMLNATIGGLVGIAINSSTLSYCYNYGDITISNSSPYSSTLFESLQLGGVVGCLSSPIYHLGSSSNITITINNMSSVAYSYVYIGGICGNLTFSRDTTLFLFNNIFNGKISYRTNVNNGMNGYGYAYIAGVIAYMQSWASSNYNMALYNCANYADISVTDVSYTYVGGILSDFYGNDVTIDYCVNFGDITLGAKLATNESNGFGGILGYADERSNTYIHNCANYGDIVISSSQTVKNVGGIVGWIKDNGHITACINYGKIDGGSNSYNVGGIAGQMGETYNVLWWEEKRTNVYITNCINYGPVKGKSSYAQIVGLVSTTGRVLSCYSRADLSNILDPQTNCGGDPKSYSYLTGTSLGNLSYVSSSYAGFVAQKIEFSVLGTYTRWTATSLVYQYYTSTERSSKRMDSAVALVPSNFVGDFSVYFYCEGRNSSNISYSSFVDVYYKELQNDFSVVEKNDWLFSLPFLVGANYAQTSQYYNSTNYASIKIQYSNENFSLAENDPVEMSYMDNGLKNTVIDTDDIVLRTSGEKDTLYIGFKSFIKTWNYSSPSFYIYFETKTRDLDETDISFYSYKDYSQGGLPDVESVNYIKYLNNKVTYSIGDVGTVEIENVEASDDLLYFNDQLNFKITPNLGYAVAYVQYDDTVNRYFEQNYVSGNIQTTYDNTGTQEFRVYYRFQKFSVAFVPIVYKVNVDNDGSTTSGIVSPKSKTIRINQNFDISNNLYFGYSYDISIKVGNELILVRQDELCKEVYLNNNYVRAITLTADEIIDALSNFKNSSDIVEFDIVVRKTLIEYTVNLHTMMNSFDNLDDYKEISSGNFLEILFDLSDDKYEKLYGSSMPDYSIGLFNNFNGSSLSFNCDVKNNDSLVVNNISRNLGYLFNVLKIEDKLIFRVDNNYNQTGTFILKVKNLVESFVKNGNENNVINLYFYYDVSTINLETGIEVENGSADGLKIDVSAYKDESSTAQNLDQIYNYSPATLSIQGDIDDDYIFLGWYLSSGDKLLSFDEKYTFIYNPLVFGLSNTNIKVVAKFINNANNVDAMLQEKKVYYVNSAQDLLWLSDQVKSGNSFENVTIVQNADIDMKDVVLNPIGNVENPFKGIYDGNNFEISNLKVVDDSSYKLSYSGLFGYIDGATIKNLTLVNGKVSGRSYVGAFVGYAKNSTIQNVNNNSCVVSTENITYYHINGKESNNYKLSEKLVVNKFDGQLYFGGIVGYAENCSIWAASNRVKIDFENLAEYVGGIAGYMAGGKILQSFSLGDSLVGNLSESSKLINDCYYTENNQTTTYLINASKTNGEKISGEYKANNFADLDKDIWIAVNGKITLKVFYWA